jgi:hypothetical protein
MEVIKMYEILIEVDRLFNEVPDRFGELRTNPVTGSGYVSGIDPIEPQKRAAFLALRARDWFARTAPQDAPPLPLSYWERENLKRGGLPHIVAWFARSLATRDYAYDEHPSFNDYACGVMASPHTYEPIREDEELRRRFPPRPLDVLDNGLYWDPPKSPGRRKRRSG